MPPRGRSNSTGGTGGGQSERPKAGGDAREREPRGRVTEEAFAHDFDQLCPHCSHCQQEVAHTGGVDAVLTLLKLKSEPIQDKLRRSQEKRKQIQDANDQLRDKLSQSQTRVTQAEGRSAHFQKAVESTRLTYENLLSQAEGEARELRLEVKNLKAELKEVRKQRSALQDELQDERDFTKQLQMEKKNNEAVLGKAQSVIVSKVSDMVSTDYPDDRIRDELDAVFEECCLWARENYAPVLEDVSEVKKRLIETGVLAPEGSVPKHNYFNFEADIVTDILLEAVLSHELCTTFLGNPYFTVCSTLWTDEASVDENVPLILQKLTDYMGTKDEEKAITWRSDTLKLLVQDSQSHEPKRTAIYRSVAKAFISRWALLIRQPVDVEEEEILVDLISKFVDLTSKLWCLKTDIQYHGLDYFGGSTRFRVRANDMVAAQVLHLEDGSTRLDGRPIPLVLRPMIDASPRVGSAGKQRVIWAKGVVWVSSAAEPRPPPLKLARRASAKPKSLMDEVLAGASETSGKAAGKAGEKAGEAADGDVEGGNAMEGVQMQ